MSASGDQASGVGRRVHGLQMDGCEAGADGLSLSPSVQDLISLHKDQDKKSPRGDTACDSSRVCWYIRRDFPAEVLCHGRRKFRIGKGILVPVLLQTIMN